MWYPTFLALTALEMLWESWISARNSAALKRRGAVEIAPVILAIFTVLYAGMYFGALLEFFLRPRVISWQWAVAFGGLFVIGKLMKLWAVRSLGDYWTMRVLILPQSKVVIRGPYRWIRHPNYIAVLMEVAAVPLIGKSFITFAIVFPLCGIVLYFRIRKEEEALVRLTDYTSQMKHKRRFLPS